MNPSFEFKCVINYAGLVINLAIWQFELKTKSAAKNKRVKQFLKNIKNINNLKMSKFKLTINF